VAGQGRTGTGKTAAFLITALTHLLTLPPKKGRKKHHPRTLIIAPTRELVVQISNDAELFARHADLKLLTVYGGVDYEKQRKAFDGGVDILIGTPGRLIDYFKQRLYNLSLCEILVVDEADRMFDLGFIKDLRFLMRRLPKYDERQSLMFSATLSYRVLELAYEHMNDPVQLRAESGDITADGVVESLYHTAMDEKFPLLVHLLRDMNVERGMIFINEKRTGERLARDLARYGFSVGILSGDVRQKKRLRILDDFGKGTLHLLVATTVSRMCSITIFRRMPRIMCTGSAVRPGPAPPASPYPSPASASASVCLILRNTSGTPFRCPTGIMTIWISARRPDPRPWPKDWPRRIGPTPRPGRRNAGDLPVSGGESGRRKEDHDPVSATHGIAADSTDRQPPAR
jgi:superfamily II DNA/RNA helicase